MKEYKICCLRKGNEIINTYQQLHVKKHDQKGNMHIFADEYFYNVLLKWSISNWEIAWTTKYIQEP